jgi:eukaryotic-like serine/threonine-protein kinase
VQPATAGDSLIGYVLADKYRVLRQIGRGGMGVVYEAEHVQLGKRVAIKLMLEKYRDDSEAIVRFQREAYSASRIGNPHIIDVVDIGTAPDGRAFVVMELLNGVPLTELIKAGPLPPWRAVSIIRQVLRAVGAAHAKGIIHRDLKPDNIFVVDNGGQQDFVKLLDFGISKVVDPDELIAATKLTTTGVVIGTPLYMAPEQAMGQPIDRFADLYAIGVILYEMLAGRPPFEGPTYAVLVSRVLTQPPPHLSTMRGGLPAPLCTAVHRALEKEPERRFRTAEEFAAALPGTERSISALELAGTIDSGMGFHAAVPPRSGTPKWPLYLVGGVMVALAAVITGVVVSSSETPPAAATTAVAPTAPTPAPQTEAPKEAPAKPAAVIPEGTLEVKTTPVGASVVVGDSPVGQSPIVVTLAPGRYHVRVEKPGFAAIDTEEDVRSNERTSVVVPLVTQSAQNKGHKTAKPKTTHTAIEAAAKQTLPMPQFPAPRPTNPPATATGDDDDEPATTTKQKPADKPQAGTKPNPY